MKVLSIGRDKEGNIFHEGSAVRARNTEYAAKMEELHIIVFALKNKGLSDIKTSDHLFIYPTNSSSRWFFVWDAIKLGKKIIVEHTFVRGKSVVTAQDPFECGFVVWCIVKTFRLPLHLQIHADFLSNYFKTSLFQRIRVMTARFLLSRAAGIRVVSQRIADSIVQSGIHLKNPVQILPIRVDVESLKTVSASHEIQEKFPEFKFVILMASRLSKEKRIGDALQAMKRIVYENPFVGLVIAGEGSERKTLETLCDSLELTKQVIFLGNRADVFSLMKSAHCFLSTSEFEGYGMSIIEAGLARLPVVATDSGVSGEILKDAENALICPVGDVACLTSKIQKLISDNALRNIISEKLESDIRAHIPNKSEYVSEYVKGLEAVQTTI